MNEYADTYIVLEIQSNGEQIACIPTTFTSWSDALSKFYQTMVSISQSKIPEHTCLIMDKVGPVRKIETIYHSEVEGNE